MRKQFQTCCQHETLSLETHDRDDISESFELPPEIRTSFPVKDTTFPSLYRRKSFNVSHVKNLLKTPEPQTPHRKSVESALPLCAGSTFKPRRLQYVKSSLYLVPASAGATPAPMPLPLPLPPRIEAPKAEVLHKSGPLPTMRQSSKGETAGNNPNSPVKMKKYLSGPLPSLQRKPLSRSPSPPAARRSLISGPLHSGGKAKQLVGGLSPTNRFTKVKSSAQTLFPAVATSKLPGMVTQGTLKKAAQLAKVTPVLDRKGSRGSRTSRVDCNLCSSIPTEVISRTASAKTPSSPDLRGNGLQIAKPAFRSVSIPKGRSCSEREKVFAAVKIQAAIRGYVARKRYALELARANNLSGELTEEELEKAPSVSTRLSRTRPQKRQTANRARAGMELVSKSWNGSLRTAQDCQAILRSKQEAALKRERAMEYAMSRQNWKTGSRSQKAQTWIVDNTFPDKPGWVWNWLERAARMGAHNSPNRIFDNDFDKDEPVSESLSVKSTVGICTTDLGSADMDLRCPMTYPWPLSLRQQHAAGLLQPKPSHARPSPRKRGDGSRALGTPLQRDSQHKTQFQHAKKREDLSTTVDSCVTSQMSDELSMNKPGFGVRKLKFADDESERQRNDQESVGSCAGPSPPVYRLSSPFAGPKPMLQSGLQLRKSNPASLKETIKVKPHAYGNSQGHQVQEQDSVALSESDSEGTTGASVHRPFWRS